MKKNNIKTRIIGAILAAVCAVSAMAAVTSVSASAAVVTAGSSVSAARGCAVSYYGKTSCGYDWDFRADNSAAKITCTYDFKTNKYTFKATANFAGVTNAVLKYATADKCWHNVPIRFTVDRSGNVTGQQTAREYLTADRYSG